MASRNGPSGFAPSAQLGKRRMEATESKNLTLTSPSHPPSSPHTPALKSSTVSPQAYSHLLLEEETELFDQDPTLGRNGPRDFSAGGQEGMNAKNISDQGAEELESQKDTTPPHVEWPSLTSVEPSSALIEGVKMAMKQLEKS